MSEDQELLRRYAGEGAEDAFAELVRRHVDLVYSVALRQVNGDAHLAQDVVQTVFADLAVKAASVARHRVLAGWLFVSARYAAAKLVRGEQRRRAREREAQLMETNRPTGGGAEAWEQVKPVLDDALGELEETDRAAILLRFFEGRGFAEVGARLELSENTARMRVERALDKLHAQLGRRGVTSTTAALAVALAGQAVTAAPTGLVAAATQAGLAAGVAGSAIGAGVFMGMTKIQAAVCGCLLAAGVGGVTWEQHVRAKLAAEAEGLKLEVAGEAGIRAENARLTQQAALVRALREGSDVELVRLGDEADALQRRLAAEALANRAVTRTVGGAKAEAKIYDPKELEKLPAAKFRSPPMYPDAERMAGKEGKALVEFVVDAAGEVVEAKVVEATTEAFGLSAEAALKKWKFDPGQKKGVPVGVRMRQPITFALSKETPPPPVFWF